jgi:hypothetical protein
LFVQILKSAAPLSFLRQNNIVPTAVSILLIAVVGRTLASIRRGGDFRASTASG